MIRTRQILAVTLVATALAADRAVATVQMDRAPMQRQSTVMSVAGRLVRRLSKNFRRVVPAMQLVEMRRREAVAIATVPQFDEQQSLITHVPLSPFQFRLPPPTL